MALNRYYWPTKYNSRNDFLVQGVKCIFISHQQKDKDSAKKIADYLIEKGVDVYFDEYDGSLKISHQSNNPKAVTDAIRLGINNSSHMLVLVSPNTLYSTWVPFEIGYGYDKTELSILCLKGISQGSLPEYLKTAKVIRDIYDFNIYVSKQLNESLEHLVKSQRLSDFNHYNHPLDSIMDKIITGEKL